MNNNIFRKYDIRGIVKDDFTPDVVKNLGRAFGSYVLRKGGSTVAISGDMRLTTPKLKENFTFGLILTGIHVIDLGIIPTPVNYFSMYHLDINGAVQITGSHNPPEFNGFKLSLNKSAFHSEQIGSLRDMIIGSDFESGEGSVEKVEILSDYLQMLSNKISISKPLKAVMDCGNAAACITGPQVFKTLGIDTTELFCELDGEFPNHHPDPTEDKNLVDIVNTIKSGKYDFGVAFDGDADRIVAIDENGRIIRSDILMSIFIKEIIQQGDSVVFDVKCSQAFEDTIIKLGGIPVMWMTGHSLIKDKMKELDVKFAGEMSGHIFFADNFYGFDDAVYVSLRLAQLLSNTDQKLSELVDKIPVYHSTPEMRIECKDDESKFELAKSAFKYFSENYKCITVDGVRIQFEGGWGLVRASNTQPVIVCRFEAKTKARMTEIKDVVIAKLQEFGDISYNV